MIMSDEERSSRWSTLHSITRQLLRILFREPDIKEKIIGENEEISKCIIDRSSSNKILNNSNESTSSGWQRLKELYSDGDVHFETKILRPCMEWTFIGTAFIRGSQGWQQAAERYHRYSKGRIFLNPRDALRRKWDYAFVSFLRTGAISGSLAALYVGCIIGAITNIAAWRNHFSLWTVPLVTSSVPCIIACPFGLRGMMQASSLGLTCGLTLSLVAYIASYFSNQTVDELYQTFKREREEVLRKERNEARSITLYQKEHNIWFKGLAKLQMNMEERSKKDEVAKSSSN